MSARPRPAAVALLAAASLLAGALAARAEAQQPAGEEASVTATGYGTVSVKPRDRRSDRSIAAALRRAQAEGTTLALQDAGRRAQELATATGLTLGAVIEVADGAPGGPFAFGPFGSATQGTFGPGRFCGTVPRFRTVRRADGTPRRVRAGTRRACRYPARLIVPLVVTYAATRES